MTYTATAAQPYVDAARTVSDVRGELRKLAAGEDATVDWSALRVTGPDEVIGRHGVTWYEWTAVVKAVRKSHLKTS